MCRDAWMNNTLGALTAWRDTANRPASESL
jgi:hypothetical protein